ncbi:VOC family protein [Shewanella gelidii]|uniref:Glyoxalase n=1 Tax=Shewanella gelidii TaxID=1642821 RepID=A0A917JX54_9GAMM|nr:VOC family protein [Shewanella gelidii]MCL1098653.1 VOC family protein [Shewanella gelidii]GGI86323.1 glyoxalase [Shewanella gelidii]
MPAIHNTINYLELPTQDLASSKTFFGQVFGWQFLDYGPEYCCFSNAGIDGGFYQADQVFNLQQGSPLIVLYHDDLQAAQEKVVAAGGVITKAVFSFPGGRRFHFTEPCGNEYAVWSD